MSYKLESIDEEKIVLSKGGFQKLGSVLMCLLGLVFLFSGWKMLFEKDSNVSVAQSLFVLSFGIMPFVVVAKMYHEHKKQLKFMIIHLTRGYIELQSSFKNVQHAFIPYSQFSKIAESKGVRKIGKKYYDYYYIQLYLKDGGNWLLFESEDQDDINDLFIKINAVINLETETVDLPPPMLSANLNVSQTDQHDAVEWKLFDWTSILSSAITATILGLVLLFLNTQDMLFSVFGAFFGFMFSIFFITFFLSLKTLVEKMDVLFGISISATDVCFYEKSNTGKLIKSKFVSISNIQSVTNSMVDNMTATNVTLYIQEKEKMSVGKLNAYQKVKQIAKSLNRMYFSNLTYIESLELERWIQERIKARAGVEVL